MNLPVLNLLVLLAAAAQAPAAPHVYAVTMRDGIHLATDVYGDAAGARDFGGRPKPANEGRLKTGQ
jgi:predicted acyl esterase